MGVPVLDLKKQSEAIHREMDEAVQRVLSSGEFVLGPHVAALEQEMAAWPARGSDCPWSRRGACTSTTNSRYACRIATVSSGAWPSGGVPGAVYYPVPLHLQPMYRDLGHYAGDFPEAERAAREVLSLPLYPELTDEQTDEVIEACRQSL